MGDPENDNFSPSRYTHRRENNEDEIHEHRRRSDGNGNGNGMWKPIATFLAGCVLTGFGAWATNGVSKADLDREVSNHAKVSAEAMQSVQRQLDTVTSNQHNVINALEEVRVDVAALKAQVTRSNNRSGK
jgi:hypothetical protein